MMRQKPMAKRGFTLLELILSTALMASIGAVLYSSLTTAYKARQAAARQVDMPRQAAIVMRMIQRDLESVQPPTGTLSGPFIGEPAGAPGVPQDTLELYTIGHDYGAADDDPFADGSRHVMLRLRTETAPVALVREVQVNLLAPVQEEPVQEVLAEDVRGLTFRYYDGTSWNDTWDSTQLGNVLPRAVEVTITLADPSRVDQGGVYTIQQVVALSCAADAQEASDEQP